MKFFLPDTRAYSESKNKNEILFLVQQLITSQSDIEKQTVSDALIFSLKHMLSNNHYLSLSVAMALAPSRMHYQIILDFLNQVLAAHENEQQFVAMPLIIVLGSQQEKKIILQFEEYQIKNILNEIYPSEIINKITWLKQILLANELVKIKAHEWYQAKQYPEIIFDHFKNITDKLEVKRGHSVELGFLIGYGPFSVKGLFKQTINSMVLMQFWNEFFLLKGVIPFINPLPFKAPIDALFEGTQIRKKMDLDIFITNSIRNIRLNNHRVASVIGTKEGGTLEISIQALEEKTIVFLYSWQLAFLDNLHELQRDLIYLLKDCRVDNLWLLKNPLQLNSSLPDYHEAIKEEGHNPIVDYIINY